VNKQTFRSLHLGSDMARHAHELANMPAQRRVTFGVSKLWIPHVLLVHLIYYVLLAPQHYGDQNAFWILGTFIRILVGEKTVNAGVAFMCIAHVFEAAYTVTLARRYETTFLVGVRCLTVQGKGKLTESPCR